MKARIAVIVVVLALLSAVYFFLAGGPAPQGDGYPRGSDIQNLKIN